MNELHEENWLDKESNNDPNREKKVRYVVTLTISYPNQLKPWSVFEVMAGPTLTEQNKQICYIHVQVEDVSKVPLPIIDSSRRPTQNQVHQEDSNSNLKQKTPIKEKMHEPFEQWLINKYVEMDNILDKFYTKTFHAKYSEVNEQELGPIWDLSLNSKTQWFNWLLGALVTASVTIGIVCLVLYA